MPSKQIAGHVLAPGSTHFDKTCNCRAPGKREKHQLLISCLLGMLSLKRPSKFQFTEVS
ncbi:hypothetical protein FA13DRAFT_1732510 [Coprinellus micaceus]|uniref:Uncharacterized protein n=1 Tax=Coprinellus micaceus TaxID=71717 RepID=A0A4Y7TCJ6_COPMI|nr:hypothetical protein FA13DRAFT_1732510 [Coprinellus micaceus]